MANGQKKILIEIVKWILNKSSDLDFLMRLDEKYLQTLIACIPNRMEHRWVK